MTAARSNYSSSSNRSKRWALPGAEILFAEMIPQALSDHFCFERDLTTNLEGRRI
jgi:hypothetical protein